MKILLFPLFLIALAAISFAQSELPDRGSLADIKGKSKVYIIADGENTKQILKAMKGQSAVVRVDRPEDAEFFLEYKEIADRRSETSLQLMVVTGQLDVYTYRDKRKVIAWTDSKVSGMHWPSLTLTKKFLKEFSGR
jgi:hypothetical protein